MVIPLQITPYISLYALAIIHDHRVQKECAAAPFQYVCSNGVAR